MIFYAVLVFEFIIFYIGKIIYGDCRFNFLNIRTRTIMRNIIRRHSTGSDAHK